MSVQSLARLDPGAIRSAAEHVAVDAERRERRIAWLRERYQRARDTAWEIQKTWRTRDLTAFEACLLRDAIYRQEQVMDSLSRMALRDVGAKPPARLPQIEGW